MKHTKNNITTISKYIQDAVIRLQHSDWTCCRLNLDSDLAIYIGWSDGYGKAHRSDVIQDPKNPTYAINVGIKIRNDIDWSDYDGLDYPTFVNKNGNVYSNGISIQPNEDYEWIAHYLIKIYNDIIRLKKQHKLYIK